MPRKPIHDHSRRLEALQTIAIELLQTRSRHEILDLILKQAMEHLACDAGSLYLKADENTLNFEVAVNQSVHFDNARSASIKVNKGGIAAYVFRTGQSLAVKDVYKLGPDCPYQFDKSFDKSVRYRTRSMLVQPLLSSKGEPLGVIQLMNRKNTFAERWPTGSEAQLDEMPYFSDEDERFLHSFSALASAAIENAYLYESIRGLFEGFVHASVKAIESRDPVTRGHSERVALLTVCLSDRVSKSQEAHLKDVRFTPEQLEEIRYAALLHDFGKIGVSESTLLKAEKLTSEQKLRIQTRIEHFGFTNALQNARNMLADLKKENRAPNEFDISRFEKGYTDFQEKLKELENRIFELNRPTVLKEENWGWIALLAKETFPDIRGNSIPLLRQEELKALSIGKGSLSEVEREEIQSHVTRTWEFLKDIPWGRDFKNVPEIAYAHHEKIDGTGYPRGLKGENIPIQSRIMAICDIYDALVSPDRPYKKGVSAERAIEILHMEMAEGKLDRPILNVFVEDKVFEVIAEAVAAEMAAREGKKAA